MAAKKKVQKKKARKKKRLGWGGARPGAGRKPIPREQRTYVPHIARPKVTRHRPVLARMICADGLPSLTAAAQRKLIEPILASESRLGFRLIHYRIGSDRIVVLCEANDSLALSRGLQRIGSGIARRLNKKLQRSGRLFKERFYSHVLESPEQTRAALVEVLLGRHQEAKDKRRKRFVGIDPCTSGRYFDGWKKAWAREAKSPREGDPVVAPKSNLLTKGWRKLGLLAAEVD